MIQKVLVCGKQVYMASQKPDSSAEPGVIVDLLMPIEAYWKAEEFLNQMNYLQASGETVSEINAVIRKIIALCIPYVMNEKSHKLLSDKSLEY